MNTLRNNQETVLTLLGFGIGMILLGAYMRGWWNVGGVGQELQISTAAFIGLAQLTYKKVKSLIEEYQTSPRK